jgi:hypothetical protein
VLRISDIGTIAYLLPPNEIHFTELKERINELFDKGYSVDDCKNECGYEFLDLLIERYNNNSNILKNINKKNDLNI